MYVTYCAVDFENNRDHTGSDTWNTGIADLYYSFYARTLSGQCTGGWRDQPHKGICKNHLASPTAAD